MAKKKMKEISDSIDQLIQQGIEKRERASKIINATKKVILDAKKSGIDTQRATILLNKAQDILGNAEELNDYDEALKYAQSARNLITTLKTHFGQASDMLKLAGQTISDLEKNGIIINQPRNLLLKSEAAFKSGDYDTASELANKSVKLAKAKKQNFLKASELIGSAYTKIHDAKSIDVDTTDAENYFNEATTKMEADDYKSAIALASKSVTAADSAKEQQVEQFRTETAIVIKELEHKIGETRRFGADIRKPSEILDSINGSLNNNEIKSTLDNIEACKTAIEEVKNTHQKAVDKLNSAVGFVTEASKSGAKVEKAQPMIHKAESALKDFDYDTVLTQATLAIEAAEKSGDLHRKLLGMKEQAEDLIRTARATMQEAVETGVKVADCDDLIKIAETAMSNKEYNLAQQNAKNAIDSCKEALRIYSDANDNILKAQTAIGNSKTVIDTASAENLYETAQSKMVEGDYTGALELAVKAYEQVEELRSTSQPVLRLVMQEGRAFKSGTWGKLELEISNAGKVNADEVELKISDEFETRGFTTIKSIKAGEKKTMGIGIRTSEIGEIPMNIVLSFVNPVSSEAIDSQEVLWVNIEAGESAAVVPAAAKAAEAAPAAARPEPAGDVKVLSEVEFFQGFVRLKVGIKNDMNTVVTDAKLDLEFDDNAMRLDFIEPELERKANKIIFGVIHPHEKRTVAFYLDPLICTESHIDGTLAFKDIYGELKTRAMKRRKAEVVCPILYTPENINTAMLKRLINEELTIHDSKIYEIPPGIDFRRASDICKDTVQGHDLKFIRQLEEHDPDDPEIESWYYGVTKVKKAKVVIKTSSRKKTNTIQMFVACQNKQMLTGFLAELGHNFNDKLKQLGVTVEPILPVTDTLKRNAVIQSNSLLNHQIPDKTTLSISKRGDEYEVTFKASEERGEASELAEFIKVSPDSRFDLVSQINDIVTVLNIFSCTRGSFGDRGEEIRKEELERMEKSGDDNSGRSLVISDNINEMRSFGQLMYGMFLPVPIQQHLEDVKEPLILKTNDNEIPWELLHDETDFLCLKVPVGRRLRSREIPRSNPVKQRERIKALFIANATGDLEGAEEEVNYILEHLGGNIDVDVLKRREATTASVLNALRSGNYDVIHYAGHAEFNAAVPDESALVCANQRKIIAQEIKRVLGGKPFVFLNACGSGQEKMCEEGESYTGSDTEGLASSFILGGSLAVIGSSWPLPDISAGMLAAEFYNNFLTGETVGESLRKARHYLKDERENDINWMAFILYGDPTIRLAK